MQQNRPCYQARAACVFGVHASLLQLSHGHSALDESSRLLSGQDPLPSMLLVICAQGIGLSGMSNFHQALRTSHSKTRSQTNCSQRQKNLLRTTSEKLQDLRQQRTLCGELQSRLSAPEMRKGSGRRPSLASRQLLRSNAAHASSPFDTDDLHFRP